MKILFIRHSLAIERDEFRGHDIDRPLVEKGIKRAKKLFKHLKNIYQIDFIFTSSAKRALQTAEILKEYFPDAKFIETPKLLPGATIVEFKELIHEIDGNIAIIGHQPDLENIIKDILYAPNLKLKLTKPSIVEIENGVLKALISYKHLKGCE